MSFFNASAASQGASIARSLAFVSEKTTLTDWARAVSNEGWTPDNGANQFGDAYSPAKAAFVRGEEGLCLMRGIQVYDHALYYVGAAGAVTLSGFPDANSYLMSLVNAWETMFIRISTQPVRRVLVGGHSLGGAAAFLLARSLKRRGGYDSVEMVSLGAPKPGNLALCTDTPLDRCVRFMTDGDSIPSVVPHINDLTIPAAILSQPFARQWDRYRQPAGGQRVSIAGLAAPSDGEHPLYGPVDANLLTWITSSEGVFARAHRIATYVDTMQAMVALEPQENQPMPNPQPTFTQLSNLDTVLKPRASLTRSAPLVRPGGTSSSGIVPTNYRPKVMKTGSSWGLYLVGLPIAVFPTRASANAARRTFYQFQRRMLRSTGTSVPRFSTAMITYATASVSADNGFDPVVPAVS